jgi:Ser/Thr protein kinase RdoA (MazF antagonist)
VTLVASDVADRFELGADAAFVGEPARGELGEVRQLVTDRGRWAVKRCYQRQRAEDVARTAEFQQAAIANGVPTPSLVTSRDGRFIEDIDQKQLRVYDWVDLLEVDRRIDVGQVGAAVARIHTTTVPDANPLDEWFTDPIRADEWDDLVGELTAARAPFAAALGERRAELVDAATLVVAPVNVRACHRDLFADNVRVTAGGELCVIDWDNAGLEDPDFELAMVVWEFCADDPSRAAPLQAAYRDAGGPARADRPAAFSMVVTVAGRLLHHAARAWLDPATAPAERDRMAGAAQEWLEEPVTRPIVERLVDALS